MNLGGKKYFFGMCYTFWAFECSDFMLSTEIGANGADFFLL